MQGRDAGQGGQAWPLPGLAGLRDRAMLLLAAAGLREAEILRLDAQHLVPSAAGLVLRLARPGAGPDAVAREVALPFAPPGRPCAVRAVEAWRRAAGLRVGPVFCKVSRAGRAEEGRRLAAGALRGIMRRRGAG